MRNLAEDLIKQAAKERSWGKGKDGWRWTVAFVSFITVLSVSLVVIEEWCDALMKFGGNVSWDCSNKKTDDQFEHFQSRK